jgi:hypothetical protein
METWLLQVLSVSRRHLFRPLLCDPIRQHHYQAKQNYRGCFGAS